MKHQTKRPPKMITKWTLKNNFISYCNKCLGQNYGNEQSKLQQVQKLDKKMFGTELSSTSYTD